MLKDSSNDALNNQTLMDQFDQLHTAQQYRALSNPGLAIGTTTSQVKITNTTVYLHAGQFKSKTTADTAFTATTHDIAFHASLVQEACYLISLNAGGTVTITMGTISSGAGTAGIPDPVAALTPVGYVRIAVAAGSTPFDASSDALGAGHLTVTYVNLGYLAPRFDAVQ